MEINQQFKKEDGKKKPITELFYKFEATNCSDEDAKRLKKIAIERFAKDEAAQLEYAVVSILREAVDKLTVDQIDAMMEKETKATKRSKNGSKNISGK